MENVVNINKQCTSCLKELPLSDFGASKKGKYGVRSWCKKCAKEKHDIYRKERLERYAQYQKNHRDNNPNYKSWDSIRKSKYRNTIKGYSSSLYSSCKNRSKNKNLDFDLTSEFIYEKLKNMKCEITGFNLTLENDSNYRINPLKPSIDRIDPKKGYTKNNIRIICWWWNVMKQDWDDETVIELIKNYGDKK